MKKSTSDPKLTASLKTIYQLIPGPPFPSFFFLQAQVLAWSWTQGHGKNYKLHFKKHRRRLVKKSTWYYIIEIRNFGEKPIKTCCLLTWAQVRPPESWLRRLTLYIVVSLKSVRPLVKGRLEERKKIILHSSGIYWDIFMLQYNIHMDLIHTRSRPGN